MTRKQHSIAVLKIIATLIGAAAIAVGVWINVEHVGNAGLSLILAAVVVTLAGAASPVLAERLIKSGQWFKAAGLALCFALAVAFSFTTTVSRTAGAKDAQIAANIADAKRAAVAQEAYEAAKTAAKAECVRRGPRCQEKERAVQEAAKALQAAPAVKAADSAADRLTAVLPVTAEQVRIYQPLILPLALELVGFMFLAIGFAPEARLEPKPASRPKVKAKTTAKPKAKKPKATPKPQVTQGDNIIPFGHLAANDN